MPKAIRTVDDIYLHPEKLYSTEEFKEKQKALDGSRREAVERIGPSLHPNIKDAF